ncbi:MAG: hypothetical protein RMY62_008420 [Nostoc sp. ZfuVER08]|nr:hypothetical protein [Nostoc sp. ZfuVER08]
MIEGYDLDCRWCDSKNNSEEVDFRGDDWYCPSCGQWNYSTDEVDKKICSLAESYVEYNYQVGSRSYAWEVEVDDDISSDSVSVVTSDLCPNDGEDYSWQEVKSCQILSSEVNERDDNTGEYCVEVSVLIAVASGRRDDEPYEDAYEHVTPDLHIIYVHLECDEEGDFCVVGFEE